MGRSLFGKEKAGLAVVFRGAPNLRHSTSDRIAEAIEHVFRNRVHVTLLSTGVGSLLSSRYLAGQWSGTLFWIGCVCIASVLLGEVTVVTFLSCDNADAPRLWLSSDCYPAGSKENLENVRKAKQSARSWNRSRLRIFAAMAAVNLAGVLVATLLIGVFASA